MKNWDLLPQEEQQHLVVHRNYSRHLIVGLKHFDITGTPHCAVIKVLRGLHVFILMYIIFVKKCCSIHTI